MGAGMSGYLKDPAVFASVTSVITEKVASIKNMTPEERKGVWVHLREVHYG